MVDTNQVVQIFRALSDETRVKIVLMLNSRARSVGEIVDLFSVSQPTISRHLRVLKQSGLVVCKRRGQQVIYAINEDGFRDELVGFLRNVDCVKPMIGPVPAKKK